MEECAVTSERSVFLVKIANNNAVPCCVDSVGIRFCGLGVVRGKQMTAVYSLHVNEAFSAKITIIYIY